MGMWLAQYAMEAIEAANLATLDALVQSERITVEA